MKNAPDRLTGGNTIALRRGYSTPPSPFVVGVVGCVPRAKRSIISDAAHVPETIMSALYATSSPVTSCAGPSVARKLAATVMLKSEMLAEDYRSRAVAAARLAAEAGLVEVRGKYEMAALKWRELADIEALRSARAHERIANLPPERSQRPNKSLHGDAPCTA